MTAGSLSSISNGGCMKDKTFNLVIRDRQPTFIILERSVIDLTAEFEYPTPLRHFWSRASVIFREWARGVCFQIPALLGMTALLLTSSPASSMSSHPAGMVCDDAQPFTGAWSRVQCNFSTEPFVPPGQNMDFPAAYIIPNSHARRLLNSRGGGSSWVHGGTTGL